MDLTKFSEENFDLKKWINGTFVAQKDTNQNAEQFVTTMVTKLQVFIQEINNSIDDTSQSTVQNFPRILREIDVLKQDSFMLKEQMKNVRDDLVKVEKDTVNDSMKLLLDLDIMRTNIMNVQSGLQEADNWTTLTSDLESILESKDISKISDHIESMQNSLVMLQDDNGEYVNRCALLEDFKNKFETLMSADIISAFNSKSNETAKRYVEIFGKMNRLDELKKYYYQCEKIKIFELNKQLVGEVNKKFETNQESAVTFSIDSAAGTNEIGDSLKSFLKNWLEYCITVWHDETTWCKNIFNDTHEIVINLLIKCFEEFNGKYLNLLDKFAASKNSDAFFLEYLTEYKQETDRFALIINSSAESLTLYKSSKIKDLLFKFLKEVYSPYKSYSIKYTNIVVKYLQYQLENNIEMSNDDTVECVQLLSTSIERVFNLIDKEIERCTKLTNGCGFSMLIEALKIFLKNYVEEFKRIIINLKERNSKTKESKKLGHNRTSSSPLNIREKTSNENDQEDWDTFRHFVKIIQIVGELIMKYEGLEDILGQNIQKSLDNKQEADLFSINSYKDYLLEDMDRIKFNGLVLIIESGDDYNMMKDLLKPLYLLSENVHKFAFDIVFAPIKTLLKNISKSNLWSKGELEIQKKKETLPLFAFAPQEFITKIGQYLLTLPQNFEPFTMQGNDYLVVALHKGKLPYLDMKDLSDDITSCWLDSIANATAVSFADAILSIHSEISVNSQRQLIIDIEFICSIFEDFGLSDYKNLQNILELLKISSEEFEEACKNKPVRVVSAIKKMRNI